MFDSDIFTPKTMILHIHIFIYSMNNKIVNNVSTQNIYYNTKCPNYKIYRA